jgi:hypothetical protein
MVQVRALTAHDGAVNVRDDPRESVALGGTIVGTLWTSHPNSSRQCEKSWISHLARARSAS